jgi:sugar phosphate isomerase/epimerase
MTTVGFHTNAFVWAGVTDLNEIADFALENGFTALEVGPGFPLDEYTFAPLLEKIGISNFSYARNFISDDEEQSRSEKQELYRRMKFASSIGVRKFMFSTGISQRRSIPDSGGMDPMASMEPVIQFLEETLDLAEELDLTMMLENCPMYRNIATSPVMWQEIFSRISSPRLGLCYDPSHFVWQMIDVYEPIREFGGYFKHIHLKDTGLDRQMLSRIGILHNVGKERGYYPNQWWRHTIIGGGEIDWNRFKKELEQVGYLDSFSFEMEDYQYERDPNKVKQGLALQRQYLTQHWGI